MHPFFDLPETAIFGHRGAGGTTPENTLLGFQHGLDLGADVLESDIHLTRDGVPVLIHDSNVDRTTNGRGPVRDFELAELQSFDAGYRFIGDTESEFPYRDQKLQIPTLEAAFASFPEARFNLELKEGGESLAAAVIRLVEQFERASRTLLAAGEDRQMQQLRTALSQTSCDVAIGACTAEVAHFARAALEGSSPPQGVMALQVPSFFGSSRLVTVPFIAFARAHEIPVHVWTVNDKSEMSELIELGIDGLITDFPGRLDALLKSRRPH